MHATTKQLLSLRDNELLAADVQQHVAQCDQCQQQLQGLRSMQQLLSRFSDENANNHGNKSDEILAANWQQIKKRAQQRRRRRWLSQWAVAASVVVCVLASLPFISQQIEDSQIAHTDGPSAQDLQAQLIARNRQLEAALQALPKLPKVVRGGTAYAIESFEDQIALVDYQLSYGQELGIDETQSVNLLQNRAQLLGSLYKVRYTQAMANLVNY